MATDLKCPRCHVSLRLAAGEVVSRHQPCPVCDTPLDLETFPALWRENAGGHAGELVTGDEASCFRHPEKRAEASCDHCGRFMCALCEVRVGAKRLCLSCFEERRRSRKLIETERHRTIPEMSAFWLALGGILLGPLGVVSGSVAVCFAVHGLVKPRSITGHRRIGAAVTALVIGLIEAIGWGFFWIAIGFGPAAPHAR